MLIFRIGKYSLDGWIESKGLGVEFNVLFSMHINIRK